MRLLLLACVGGALGSGARYLVSMTAARLVGTGFPWGTLAVNIVGSLLMGMVIEAVAVRYEGSLALRTFFATGVLGGFTTFSAFSLEVVQMLEQGETAAAAAYIVVSVLAAVVALGAGLVMARVALT